MNFKVLFVVFCISLMMPLNVYANDLIEEYSVTGDVYEVTDVRLSVLADSAKVSYLTPPNGSFLYFNFYLDGFKVGSSANSYFWYSGLVPSSHYDYMVSVVDLDGFESDGYVGSFSTVAREVYSSDLSGSYDSGSLVRGVEVYFSSYWKLLAFIVSIPVSFFISKRIKSLFIS